MLRKLISPPHLAIALLALLCAGIAYAAAYTGTIAVVWRTPPSVADVFRRRVQTSVR